MVDHEDNPSLTYPAYIVGSKDGTSFLSVTVESHPGQEWIPLYATQELAELFVAQLGEKFGDRYGIIVADSEYELRRILVADTAVAGFILNAAGPRTRGSRIIQRDRFFEQWQ